MGRCSVLCVAVVVNPLLHRFEDQPVLLSFGESTTHSHKSSAARDSSASVCMCDIMCVYEISHVVM